MRRHKSGRAPRSIGILTLVALSIAPSPQALAREADTVVDLRTAPSWFVDGASGIGPLGDVNGDGAHDMAVADCHAGNEVGEVRVVWGPFDPDEVTFENPGAGFTILGVESMDYACHLSMRPVGDVNGDGLDDVLVAADRHQRDAAVYVVFGKEDSETVHLRDFDEATQGDQGYIVHKVSVTYIGVERLGDMNEDGLADFVVGGSKGGNTYVVFGQSSTLPVDVRTFELGAGATQGFLIKNRCRECIFGSVGDVNGDGVPDVGVGGVGRLRYEAPGSAYVVFGKSDSLPVDTSRQGTPQFFKIKGDTGGSMWGGAIAAAGDVNGDGLDDVVVGMPRAYEGSHGKAAVIFGKSDTDTVWIEHLGDKGFQVFGAQRNADFGIEATGVGDLDDDGHDDIAFGAGYYEHGRRWAGAVFVIYGSRRPHDLRTGRLGDAGFVIVGRESGDLTGGYIGAPGDINGDGVPELTISAPAGGKAYLLWPKAR